MRKTAMASLFNTNLNKLSGIGAHREQLFLKLGVSNIGALLYFFPRSYEDLNNIYSIESAPLNKPCCIKTTITESMPPIKLKSGFLLSRFRASDGISFINISFFNNPFIKQKLKTGKEYLFFGKIKLVSGRREIASPKFYDSNSACGINPTYLQTQGLSSKQIATAIKNALALLPEKINDPLPLSIRKKYGLCDLKFAIENMHFPKSQNDLNSAKKRLIFEELLTLQLGLFKIKNKNRQQNINKIKKDHSEEFFKLLPFSLTNAQKRVISESLNDMKSDFSMARLIQGDVGCGKTVAAAALCYTVIKEGLQVAFMAPTEILAEQHYQFLSKLFAANDINVSLLCGKTSKSQKKTIKSNLKSGDIQLIVGTHALLTDDVTFSNLGLVITDEQHRFGVNQRAKLYSKGQNPHTLVMSATPIPRSLALVIYGDLDISIIDQMPQGRQKIDSFLVTSKERLRAINFIKKLVQGGQQAYIVCPLIEENESDLTSAKRVKEEFSKSYFSEFNVGLLHGKLKPSEKNLIMSDFVDKKINILVCTTVIEVGIDVPNATVIMIESAERLGLSQLHQLRGRVGRGFNKSYCILISDNENEESIKRLNAILKTTDGFKIAGEDLSLRGPGDFFGTRQHGLPPLKLANLMTDLNILSCAKEACEKILKIDPELNLPEHKLLKSATLRFFSEKNF